jgi:hypothetical protein
MKIGGGSIEKSYKFLYFKNESSTAGCCGGILHHAFSFSRSPRTKYTRLDIRRHTSGKEKNIRSWSHRATCFGYRPPSCGPEGGFAMQCDKNDYRGVLAGLEGVTGKKAMDSEALTVKN